jgi:hypothetical protein
MKTFKRSRHPEAAAFWAYVDQVTNEVVSAPDLKRVVRSVEAAIIRPRYASVREASPRAGAQRSGVASKTVGALFRRNIRAK